MLCEGDTFLFKAGQQRQRKAEGPGGRGKKRPPSLCVWIMPIWGTCHGHLGIQIFSSGQAEARELVAHFRACFQTTQAIISEDLKQTAAW